MEKDTDKLKELVDALVDQVAEKNKDAIDKVLQELIAPLLQSIEKTATAQVALAAALRTNRRDRNATEIAKLLVEHFMRKDGSLQKEVIHLIGDHAYAVAEEMEVHALVGEARAQSKLDRVKKSVESAPLAARSDATTLARSFLGKTPVPRKGE